MLANVSTFYQSNVQQHSVTLNSFFITHFEMSSFYFLGSISKVPPLLHANSIHILDAVNKKKEANETEKSIKSYHDHYYYYEILCGVVVNNEATRKIKSA